MANNTYTGDTTVNAGVLRLTGSISNSAIITIASGAILDATGRSDQTLTLDAGQTLIGSGQVNGNLGALNGATIALGNMGGSTFGTLMVQSDVTLNGSLLMKLNRTNVQASDQLVTVSGRITGGGTLTVTNSGPALQAGDVFELFNAPVGGFSTVTLPGLMAGVAWTNRLAVDGTIQVVQPVATNAAPIMVQIAANNLTLDWPSDHTGWWLQEATNLVVSNWVNVAGSTATNRMVFTIDPTMSVTFFRLLSP